jgi:hypothetical protein
VHSLEDKAQQSDTHKLMLLSIQAHVANTTPKWT